jgi:glutathione synthase/RimK-type ligase-like ATP-grasp enzyme
MEKVLGIMTHRFAKQKLFDLFMNIASHTGFDKMIVFTPSDVQVRKQRIRAHYFRQGRWVRGFVPLPEIGHDIGYYSNPVTIAKVKKIKKRVPFTGHGLGNKWNIHERLASSSFLSDYIIPTAMLKEIGDALHMAQMHKAVMIKPLNGSKGRGIMRLSRAEDGYRLEENGKSERTLSTAEAEKLLETLKKKGKYIVQKWLDIRSREGYVFDIRSLVQKNKNGGWQQTGIAVRQGRRNSVTSNLKGGGLAYEVEPYLKKQFEDKQAETIYTRLREVAEYIPDYLEREYRKRFVELGIDLAVDRDGRIWIIEINIKPGKTIMSRIYSKEAARKSIAAPIEYAYYLAERLTAHHPPAP